MTEFFSFFQVISFQVMDCMNVLNECEMSTALLVHITYPNLVLFNFTSG